MPPLLTGWRYCSVLSAQKPVSLFLRKCCKTAAYRIVVAVGEHVVAQYVALAGNGVAVRIDEGGD